MAKRLKSSTSDILKKVRRIELKTKGLSNQIFSGEYQSSFKGRGMAFSEAREYAIGDEIRTIDWNVTARFNEPYVKVFEEERELSVIILVDVSASDNFGTKDRLKRELIAELSAIMSFSAIQNNDKIGVILFSDKVEKFIPPKKGKSHALRIIKELLEFEPESKGTDIKVPLEYLNQVTKKRTICFLISDFIADKNYEKALKIANKRHDLVALRVFDEKEKELPKVGLVHFKNPETGEAQWVNTWSRKTRDNYKKTFIEQELELQELMKRSGVDYESIPTDGDYVKPLMNLFKRR